ncbi:MAG: hypothetical protein ACRDGR_06020 [bacterium]
MRSLASTLLAACLLVAASAVAEDGPGGSSGPAAPPVPSPPPIPPGPLRDLAAGAPQPVPDSVVLEHDTECTHQPLFGGILVPLGAHVAHVEVTFEPHTSLFTGYILDAEALEPVRIKQSHLLMKISTDFLDQDRMVLLAAKEDEATGERTGDTSVFWGGNKKLIGATMFAAMIDQIAIQGHTYREVEFSYPR